MDKFEKKILIHQIKNCKKSLKIYIYINNDVKIFVDVIKIFQIKNCKKSLKIYCNYNKIDSIF